MSELEGLFEKLKVAPNDDLCEIELDIFALVYDRKEENDAISAALRINEKCSYMRDGIVMANITVV